MPHETALIVVVGLLLAALIHLESWSIHMNLNDLLGQVQAQKTVADSVVTMMTNLSGQLQTAINELNQAGANTAQLQAIADALAANTNELSAAVTANTPVPTVPPLPAASPAIVAEQPAPTTTPAPADSSTASGGTTAAPAA